ncbi:NAD(P)-binding domain-containing protein [Weissella ceti]|uniref:NAD(P)-binding domain-containing protein n=1 Tax=Weissella ceti TaxID=759620 RepID=A0ABT3E3G9_9LACO|nr:NAD(P)-binding domain-containing protein [Weissella ceti]MCW0952932.1 NAD(P)-binding domain-containing protein [Weissella ceti]QVK11478.1 NAD(P)-binding domain-containing protein [Weissella ceti]
MTQRVGIIGMGNVGCAVAQGMIAQNVADEYVFLNRTEEKATANKLDFEDAMGNDLMANAKIIANDWSALKDADVLISTLGDIGLQKNSHGDRFAEMAFTSEMVRDVSQKIKASGFNGVLIVMSNPLDVITTLYQQETELPANQVVGTGTALDTARMQRVLADELDIHPRSITGYSLGEHGQTQFVAWSTVKALGMPMVELAAQRGIDLDEVAAKAGAGAKAIMKGKGFTCYGVAMSGIRIAKAVLSNTHEELVLAQLREGESVYYSYPAIIGSNGVVQSCQLNLTDEEETLLATSRDFIAEKFAEVATKA